jgi:hypothetical protein
MAAKTILQISLLRGFLPYILLALAGAADLATTLIGVRMLGMMEGNLYYIPFLTQAVIIAYIFVIRKIPAFPTRIEKVCEAGVVIYSFSPVIWNLFLILIRLFS